MRDSHRIIFYCHLFESTKDIYRYHLDEVDKQRRDRRIYRIAIQMYNSSHFHYLYDSGNNQALLNYSGFNYEKFKDFWDKLCTRFDNYTFDELSSLIHPKINSEGRHRNLSTIEGLGLVLMWYRTSWSCSRNLAISFGQTCTPLYKWVRFGLKILLSILINDGEVDIKIPIDENFEFYKECIGENHPHCCNVLGALDGFKTTIQNLGHEYI